MSQTLVVVTTPSRFSALGGSPPTRVTCISASKQIQISLFLRNTRVNITRVSKQGRQIPIYMDIFGGSSDFHIIRKPDCKADGI